MGLRNLVNSNEGLRYSPIRGDSNVVDIALDLSPLWDMVEDIDPKRVNFSGRTVIGPDPTLKLGQVAIPPSVASNLTIPVRVCNFNIKQLTELINTGKANYVLRDNGKIRINLKYAMFRKGTELLYGDIIIREDTKIIVGKEIKNISLKLCDKLIRNGEEVEDIRFPQKKKFKLNIGDVVERHLQNKDIVLVNRQPTKHMC